MNNITLTRGQLLLLFAVVAYWVSPIDALPGLPFDDWAIALYALSHSGDLSTMIERMIGGGK